MSETTASTPASLLRLRPNERVVVLIDGASLYSTQRALGFDMDYRKLRDLFASSEAHLRFIDYFALLLDGEAYSPLRPLTDWLDYNGYRVTKKTLVESFSQDGHRRVLNSVLGEMTVEMLEAAPFCDHFVLFAGDSDLMAAVRAVKRRGCKVTVVGNIMPAIGGAKVADELRREADAFVALADLVPFIAREQKATVSAPPARRPVREPMPVGAESAATRVALTDTLTEVREPRRATARVGGKV